MRNEETFGRRDGKGFLKNIHQQDGVFIPVYSLIIGSNMKR
jgi:hypothetical protein